MILLHAANTQVSRYNKDKPFDHSLTRSLMGGLALLPRKWQSRLSDLFLERKMRSDFGDLDQNWRLLPAPSDTNSQAVFNERIVPLLRSEEVKMVHRIKRFDAGNWVELQDGSRVEVDDIILATGYRFCFDILSQEADPTATTSGEWDAHPNSNDVPYPRLYQTLFPPGHADSLAFVGPCMGYTFAAFKHADMASQAVAQVWSGHYQLPSRVEMEAWCDESYVSAMKIMEQHRISKPPTDGPALEVWLNRAAGNGVEEHLGWSWRAWSFWFQDHELYRLIMRGVDTPYVGRLFAGRAGSRTRWSGARDAILRANDHDVRGKPVN